MINNVIIPTGEVRISSNKSLVGLADEISEKLLAGLKFGGLGESMRNEDPAVFIRSLLGLEVVLWHDLDEPDVFHLEVSNSGNDFATMTLVDKNSMEFVDVSAFMVAVLRSNGFRCE
jgi:hypothetical protein